jgi:hypothetical protein
MNFRYQTFIPSSKIFGYPVASLSRPWRFFNGNGRSYDPNGSYKYRFDARVTFGSTHHVGINRFMGTTIAYGCTNVRATDCVTTDTKTAPLSALSTMNLTSGQTTADFTFVAAATNPLAPSGITPAIDAGVAFHLRPGGTTIRGIHDNMPLHEVWYYAEGWGEWQSAYRSTSALTVCLFGRQAGPGCEQHFSVLL